MLNEGNAENSEVEKKDVNKMLRCAGFNAADVVGITKNDFRANQVEVCFANGVVLDIPVIETNERIMVLMQTFQNLIKLKNI
mgnify:CR=1 FL=1